MIQGWASESSPTILWIWGSDECLSLTEFVIATLSGDGDNRVASAVVTLEWQHKDTTRRSTAVVATTTTQRYGSTVDS